MTADPHIQLSREQAAYLAEKWDDCLCHNCLLKIKENWDEICELEKQTAKQNKNKTATFALNQDEQL